MCSYKSNDENIPDDTETYYETLASQEEIYLEDVEEITRVRFISCDQAASANSGSTVAEDRGEGKLDSASESPDASDAPCIAEKLESLDEQLDHLVEELTTGDSDDPATLKRPL